MLRLELSQRFQCLCEEEGGKQIHQGNLFLLLIVQSLVKHCAQQIVSILKFDVWRMMDDMTKKCCYCVNHVCLHYLTYVLYVCVCCCCLGGGSLRRWMHLAE